MCSLTICQSRLVSALFFCGFLCQPARSVRDALHTLDLDLWKYEPAQTVRFCQACEKPEEKEAKGPNHFRLRAVNAREVFPGMRYFVAEHANCDGKELGHATAVPWIDPGPDVVTNSSIDFFVNVTVAWHELKVTEGPQSAFVCAAPLSVPGHAETTKQDVHPVDDPSGPELENGNVGSPVQERSGECVCSISLAPPKWVLPPLIDRLVPLPRALEAKFMEMNNKCPRWAIRIWETFAYASSALFFIVCAHAVYSGRKKKARDEEHRQPPPILPEPEWTVPTPGQDLKKWAPQALIFVLNIVALHQILLYATLKSMDLWIAIFVVIWPSTFGMMGLMRIICTMCKGQLVHAALLHGVCIREPAGAGWSLKGLVIGILLLIGAAASCTGTMGIISFVIMARIALGPTLSLLKPFTLVRDEDKAIWSTMNMGSLMAFARVEDEEFSRGEQTFDQSEGHNMQQTLQDGFFRFVMMGPFLRAARDVPDRLAVASNIQFDREDYDESWQSSFHLADLSWHSHFVHSATGSKVAYLNLPYTILLALILLGATVLQGVNIACMHPELEDLKVTFVSLQPHFSETQHRYAVYSEQTYRSIALHTTADSDSTSELKFAARGREVDDPEAGLSALKTAPIRERFFPDGAAVEVNGLLKKHNRYEVDFFPTRVLPTSVLIKMQRGDSVFERCVFWTDLKFAEISVPSAMKAPPSEEKEQEHSQSDFDEGAAGDGLESDVTLDVHVAFADHLVGLPLPQDESDTAGDWITTVFKPFPGHSSLNEMKEICLDRCLVSRRCFDTYHNMHGCFFIMQPGPLHGSTPEEQCLREHSDKDVPRSFPRHWNFDRKVYGAVRPSRDLHHRSVRADVVANHSSGLSFRGVQPHWYESRSAKFLQTSELNFRMQAVVGEEVVAYMSHLLTLRHGPSFPYKVLVSAIGGKSGLGPFYQVTWTPLAAFSSIIVNTTGAFLDISFEKYHPTDFDFIHVYLAPLFKDSKFKMQWPKRNDLTTDLNGDFIPHFAECSEDPLLQERFSVCNRRSSVAGEVARLHMSPWDPPSGMVRMAVVPKGEDDTHGVHFEEPLALQPITWQFMGVHKPVQWALEDYCAKKEVMYLPAHAAAHPAVVCQMMRMHDCRVSLTIAGTGKGWDCPTNVKLHSVAVAILAGWGMEGRSSDVASSLRCMKASNAPLPGEIKACQPKHGRRSAAFKERVCLHLPTTRGHLAEFGFMRTALQLKNSKSKNQLPPEQVLVPMKSFMEQAQPQDGPEVDWLLAHSCQILVTPSPWVGRLQPNDVSKLLKNAINQGRVHAAEVLTTCFKKHYNGGDWFNARTLAKLSVAASKKYGVLVPPRIFFGSGEMSLGEAHQDEIEFQRWFVNHALIARCAPCIYKLFARENNLGQDIVLKHLPRLEVGPADQEVVMLLAALLPALPELTQLELSCAGAPRSCVAPATMWSAIGRMTQLELIHFEWVDLHCEGTEGQCKGIADLVERHPSLQDLMLRSAQMSGDEIQSILRGLNRNLHPKLRKLDLRGNKILSQGAALVAESMSRMPDLESLCLSDVGRTGAKALAMALRNTPALKELRIEVFSQPRDDDPEAESVSIGDEGCAELAKALPLVPELIKLDLHGHQFTPQCAKLLFEGLASTHKLQELQLDDNAIDAESVEVLAALISAQKLKNLRYLQLASNSIQSPGAQAIARALEKARYLLEVHLDDNGIEDDGGQILADAIATLPKVAKLQTVTYEQNLFSEDVEQELEKAVGKLKGGRLGPKPGPKKPGGKRRPRPYDEDDDDGRDDEDGDRALRPALRPMNDYDDEDNGPRRPLQVLAAAGSKKPQTRPLTLNGSRGEIVGESSAGEEPMDDEEMVE